MSNFDSAINAFIILCICIGFAVWGLWELIDWLFIADVIKSKELITPEIKIIVKDNVVDTLYIYRKP